MTVCAAKNCRNTSLKGAKMCYFPSNPEQKAKWITNIGRENWLPNKYSALCEYHFVADAFEKQRVDGTKKLKLNAIPTIFGELVSQISNKRKTDTECRSEKTSTATHCTDSRKDSSVLTCEHQDLDSTNIFYEKEIPVKEENTMISVLKPIDLIQKCTEKNPYFQEEASTSTVIAVDNTCTEKHSNDNTEVAKLVNKCKKFEQLYKQSEKLKIKMKRTYKQKEMALKRRIKTLEQQVRRTTVTELWMHQLQIHGFNT